VVGGVFVPGLFGAPEFFGHLLLEVHVLFHWTRTIRKCGFVRKPNIIGGAVLET
jgi:hypothetical protein